MNDLHDMSEEEWDKCWAVNVKGQMALLRAALPQFNKNPEGGSFIMTSSIAVSPVHIRFITAVPPAAAADSGRG